MRRILDICLVFAALGSAADAQLMPQPPARTNPSDLPIPSSLHDAWRLRELPLDELRAAVGRGRITIDDARRIQVEIVGPKGSQAVSDAFVGSFGGSVDTRWNERVDTWIPLDFLMDLTRALPAGHRLVRPDPGQPEDVTGEGPGVLGTDAWREGGSDGSGKVIAVIDSGWSGLSMAIANGDAPSSYVAINYTGETFESGSVHGTGCLEQVFDHAPGATYRLYRTDSATDYNDVIKNCQTNGVDIISRSLGLFNEGWWDDESVLCDAINDAAASGMLWVNSAGNYADRHWEGGMNSGAASPDWHDFVTGDETLQIQVPAGDTLNLYLSWDDDPSGSEDYDLYLFDMGFNVLTSSTSPFEFFEDVSWENTSAGTVTVQVAIWRAGGAATTLELFGNAGSWEYSVAASSVTPGLSCSNSNLITVAAVDHADFDSPGGTSGIATSYSSRGPTNSGNPLIDVAGPTNVTCLSYPGGFSGTSCAAPNVAGLAACLWSSVPNYKPNPIRWLVRRHGSVFRDWGAGGDDHIYGQGGASLIDFAPGTRWLTDEYGNPSGNPDHPTNNLQDALSVVPSGGRIVSFPGGAFPDLFNGSMLVDQPVTIVSRGATAVLSQ